ncbi:hypothetical protein L7F22_057451 [Adiantum nelumboides]|nr:hypothetical protein [Adiantum nelumboides]
MSPFPDCLPTVSHDLDSQAVGYKMKSPAHGLSRHKTAEKGTMSDSELELQDQTPPTNHLVTRSSPSKVEVKVKAAPGTLECVASNSKQSTNSLKALDYLRLSKFSFSNKELHEEYGLSLEGKLPEELSDKDIPDEEWLSVFKCLHKKNTKLFLNHVRDEFVDEFQLLYQKVYKATPSNETNADKSSHVPELDENIIELLELDKSNIELSEGFQHGKAVVKSEDRVEDPEEMQEVVGLMKNLSVHMMGGGRGQGYGYGRGYGSNECFAGGRGRGMVGRGDMFQCYNCGEWGHKSPQCDKPKRMGGDMFPLPSQIPSLAQDYGIKIKGEAGPSGLTAEEKGKTKRTTREQETSDAGPSHKRGKQAETGTGKEKKKRKLRRHYNTSDFPLGEGQPNYNLRADLVGRKADVTFGQLMEMCPVEEAMEAHGQSYEE